MKKRNVYAALRKGVNTSLATMLSVSMCGLPAFASDNVTEGSSSEVSLAADVAAEEFNDGTLYYTVTGVDTVQVGKIPTSVGTRDDWKTACALVDTSAKQVTIPATVQHNGATYNVTSIGSYAFYSTSITNITLPNGLKTIGEFSFFTCRTLTGITIPDSVESIGRYAFYSNNALASVNFGENSQLTTLGDGCFAYETSNYVNDGDKTTSALKTITLPAKLEEIPMDCFRESRALEEVIFKSESLTRIGHYAFEHCESLRQIDIPVLTDRTTGILGQNCFAYCTAMTQVIFRGDMDWETSNYTTGTEFAHDDNVTTVVCYGKDLYQYGYDGNHGLDTFPDTITKYLTVYFYETQADAEARTNATGYVVVPEGTTKEEVALGSLGADKIFDSENYQPGQPYVFIKMVMNEGETDKVLHSSDGITDLVSAYKVNENDLSNADIVLKGSDTGAFTYWDEPIDFGLTVVTASGEELSASNYDISVKDSTGKATTLPDIKTAGTYTITVTGKGAYTGSTQAVATVQVGQVTWNRLSGSDRYGTMRAIVRQAFSSYSYAAADQNDPNNVRTEYVVVANAGNYPDALAASSLAGALGGPVLLTKSDELSSEARAEVSRVGAQNVVIVGGTGSVSTAVEDALKATYGVQKVYRISGKDRYATANDICVTGAGSVLKAKWSDTCIIASGANFADALAMSAYGFSSKSPIFLADPTTGLNTDTISAIRSQGFKNVIIAGGVNSVPTTVESQLSSLNVKRLAGSDRYETSLEIAKYFVGTGDLNLESLIVATGANFPDALAGSSLCGVKEAPMLLVNPDNPDAVLKYIEENRSLVRYGSVLGGTGTIPDSVYTAIQAALEK